jgi:DNA-directed RNA polymerase subunit N
MMVNIRCWSCGKPIAQLWESYKDRVASGEDRKKVMDDLGLQRYCCRASILGHVDLVETAAQFKKF